MDIIGKETLETMLKDFKGTLIFVSHDRYFVKQVATQLLVFEDGTTNLYKFGYDEYQDKLDRDAQNEDGAYKPAMDLGGLISNKGAALATPVEAVPKKVNINIGKERSKVEKKVKRAEEELAAKEEKLESFATVKLWNGGKAYYYLPIAHLAESGADAVVRNHVYKMNLNSVAGLGTPVPNSDKVIIPEKVEGDELSYIAASVYVLKWQLVENNVNLK